MPVNKKSKKKTVAKKQSVRKDKVLDQKEKEPQGKPEEAPVIPATDPEADDADSDKEPA